MAKVAADDVRDLKRHAPELGEKVTVIEKDEAELRKHKVKEDAAGATLTTGAGSLWPYKLIAFILEKLIKEGHLNLQTKTTVTKIEPCTNDTVKGLATGPRQILHTPRGSIKARHVILATNAYTSHLLPEFADLIVPERGVMTALLPPAESKRLDHSYGFVGALGANPVHVDYLVQRPFTNVPNPAGHLMFGGGYVRRQLGVIGETDDSILDEGSTKYLREMLLKMLILGGETDGLTELEATHQWSGIWGTSKDVHPWVGAVPGRPGVWLAGGYSGASSSLLIDLSEMLLTMSTGHGMPNATLCGKAVVEMVLAELSGVAVDAVQNKLVADGNLPKAYLITRERIERCEKLDSVQAQDEKGTVGIRSLDAMVQVQRNAKL